MGDTSARYTPREVKSNPREQSMKVKTNEHRWQMWVFEVTSFKTSEGSSKRDILVTKNDNLEAPITPSGVNNGGSNHYSVVSTMSDLQNDTASLEKGQRFRKHRNNTRIVTVAT